MILTCLVITLAVRVILNTSSLTQKIENLRVQTITQECQDQNSRHTATIKELSTELTKAAERPHVTLAQRQQIANSKTYTALLIDRIEPTQNCQFLAYEATHFHNTSP